MPIVKINGKEVHIKEGHSVDHAVKYLEANPDNAKAFFEDAHHNHTTGVAHFETHRPAGYTGSTKFTIIHTGHDQYALRKEHVHGLL